MTLRDLKQYRSICAEINFIRMELKQETQHSTVRGSDSEHPYISHTMSVSGLPKTDSSKVLLSELRKLKAKKREIESFIADIDDYLTRRIFELRFFKGLSWVQISFRVGGGGHTADSLRMACNRYILKSKKSENF